MGHAPVGSDGRLTSFSPMVRVVEPPPSRLTASGAQRLHDACAFLEARSGTVAGLSAVYNHGEKVPLWRENSGFSGQWKSSA
jgi:hypothetical protein